MIEPRQTITALIWACIFGLITGMIAKRKGRSFGGYWAFGVLMFLVALPYVLLMKSRHPVSAKSADTTEEDRAG